MVLELLPRAREKVRTAWAMPDPIEHMERKVRGEAIAGDGVVLILEANNLWPVAKLTS